MSNPPRRLLLISYHFPPSSEVAGKPTARLVRHLPKFGWDVVVLTIPPASCPYPLDRTAYADVLASTRVEAVAPGFHLFQGALAARDFARRALGHGPRPAVPPPPVTAPRQVSSLRRRLRAYTTYPDRQAGWVVPAARRASELLRGEPFDAVMTVSPPHSASLIGLHLKRRVSRLPWVAQFHDPWVGNPFRDEDWVMRTATACLERAVVRAADAVLLATDRAAATYAARYPDIPGGRFGVLYNGYDPLDFPPAPPAAPRASGPVRFVYTGALYEARDPFPFLRAVADLLGRGVVARDQVRVELIGDCEHAAGKPVRPVVAELGLEGVVTVGGLIPYPEALDRLRAADVLLLFAQGQSEQVPAKLYEYLHPSKPILAFTDGATADVLRATGGMVVGPADDVGEVVAGVVRSARGGADRVPGGGGITKFQAVPLAESLAVLLNKLAQKQAAGVRPMGAGS